MVINRKIGEVEIHLDTARLEGNLGQAQAALNAQIVADCEPLIPFQQGALRGSHRFPQGIKGEDERGHSMTQTIPRGIIGTLKIGL